MYQGEPIEDGEMYQGEPIEDGEMYQMKPSSVAGFEILMNLSTTLVQ